MAYRCYLCGVKFDEPASVREDMYHSEVGATESLYTCVCPICGAEEFGPIYGAEEAEDEDDE